jgi:L-2-hydroxyglutarate oxidase
MIYDLIVIGGGIVGLASTLQLLKTQDVQSKPLKILILEKEREVAVHQSSRNSGVIHSGIYYKPGSLKATNCINGYRLLLDYLEKKNIQHEVCGKIIVATKESELPQLDMIFQRGIFNGLQDLKILDSDGIREHEPFVKGLRGVFVPQAGIVSYKKVAQSYLDDLKNLGAEVHFAEKVMQIHLRGSGVEVVTDQSSYTCKLILNCAGLFNDRIARLINSKLDMRIIPFRGEYYKLKAERKKLVRHLVYPVPNPEFPFLGVHFTRMHNGEVEAGPNAVLAMKREGYLKTDFSLEDILDIASWPGFYHIIRKYWKNGLDEYYRSLSKFQFTKALQELIPEIEMNDLEPADAGVRAQSCDRKGRLIDDFVFEEDRVGIHVLNAPSPAATSSLSIGLTVAKKISDRIV